MPQQHLPSVSERVIPGGLHGQEAVPSQDSAMHGYRTAAGKASAHHVPPVELPVAQHLRRRCTPLSADKSSRRPMEKLHNTFLA